MGGWLTSFRKGVMPMSVAESLMFAVAFATLIVLIIDIKK